MDRNIHTTYRRLTKYCRSSLLTVYGATLTRLPERPEQHHFLPTQSHWYAGRYNTLPPTFEITWWLRAPSPDPIHCWLEMHTARDSKDTMRVRVAKIGAQHVADIVSSLRCFTALQALLAPLWRRAVQRLKYFKLNKIKPTSNGGPKFPPLFFIANKFQFLFSRSKICQITQSCFPLGGGPFWT